MSTLQGKSRDRNPCSPLYSAAADLLKLADLVVEVIDAPLVVQAELREQVCAELGLQ